ncbi:MAG: GerMN domain-containing protein [Candidatus Onthomonas sp.]
MRRIFTLLLCGALLLLLGGCGGQSAKEELPVEPGTETADATQEKPEPETENAPEEEPELETENAPEEEPELETAVEPVTVAVYCGDENCEYLISEEVQIPELTPQGLADLLYSRGVLSDRVTVNDFSQGEDGVLSLDLSSAFINMLNGSGTAGEYILMGSLANTFLDAYEAEEILITVDGGTLESGHTVYDQPLTFFEN